LRRRKFRRQSSKISVESVKSATRKVTKLIDDEEAATGNVGWGVYWRYFKAIGLWLTVVGFLTNFLYQAASVYSNSEKIIFKPNAQKIKHFSPQFGSQIGHSVKQQRMKLSGETFTLVFTVDWESHKQ
jgi:hypothetical protein